MVIKNKYIPFGRFKYMSVWPFIFIKKDISEVKINHERIHAAQQKEVFFVALVALIIFRVEWVWWPFSYFAFYLVYSLNWVVEVIKMWCGGDKKAYKDLWFEKEAKDHEEYSKYLEIRGAFAWLKYILKKK